MNSSQPARIVGHLKQSITLTAECTFIDWMIWIPFRVYYSAFAGCNYNTAANATIGADGGRFGSPFGSKTMGKCPGGS